MKTACVTNRYNINRALATYIVIEIQTFVRGQH